MQRSVHAIDNLNILVSKNPEKFPKNALKTYRWQKSQNRSDKQKFASQHLPSVDDGNKEKVKCIINRVLRLMTRNGPQSSCPLLLIQYSISSNMASAELSGSSFFRHLQCRDLHQYLGSLPSGILDRLYNHPAICLAVFRWV